MESIAFRVPEDHHDALEAYAEENDVTLSEAAREHIERGLEYDDLQSENERLRNERGTMMERYQGQRDDEVEELRTYVRMQREKEQVGWWTRQKWRLFGRDDDS